MKKFVSSHHKVSIPEQTINKLENKEGPKEKGKINKELKEERGNLYRYCSCGPVETGKDAEGQREKEDPRNKLGKAALFLSCC